MRFKVSLIVLLCLATHVKAQNSPEEIVTSFGEALSSWCSTNEIIYREKIDELCSGAKKCRVEDKIHAEYQKGRGLTNYETFVLDSYMNMFQSLIPQSLNYQMSNIKVVGTDEMPEGTLTFITADINVSGAINKRVTDLFLVRNDKITGIYSHSSNLGFSHLNSGLIRALKLGRYVWISGFENGYAVVKNEFGNEGLIDIKGNVIVPCMYDLVSYNKHFAKGEKVKGGAANRVVDIDSVYYTAYFDLRLEGKRLKFHPDKGKYSSNSFTYFIEGYCIVNNGDKYGFLQYDDFDYSNVKFIYKYIHEPFCDGYALVENEQCRSIIYNDNGTFREILTDLYKDYTIESTFHDGLARVRNKETGLVGFINSSAQIVVPCNFTKAYDFVNGLCCISNYNSSNNVRNASRLNASWGERGIGLIDKKGNIILPCEYAIPFGSAGNIEPQFHDGYLPIFKNIKEVYYGTFLGTNGKPLPNFNWEYQELEYFTEGLAPVIRNGMRCYINTDGNIVHNMSSYDFICNFNNGTAVVAIDKGDSYKFGLINIDGIPIMPCIYDGHISFENGIAVVNKDGKVGVLDVYGNSIFIGNNK